MDAIKRQLRSLTAKQLAEVMDYARGLRLQGGDRSSTDRPPTSWVQEAFENECKSMGLGGINERCRKTVSRHITNLEEYANGACAGDPLIVKRAVLGVGIRLVYETLAYRRGVVTPATLATNLGRIPAALDREFPGYARIGMLGKIIRP